MRQRDPLTAEEARELDALERALAGDRVDLDLRELAELVEDVRATAPEMSPGFAARLEHQVAEGFPQAAEPQAGRGLRRRRWVLIPAGGALAAALVAVVVVLGNDHASTDPIDSFASRGVAAPKDGGASSGASGTPSATGESAAQSQDSSANRAAAKRAPAAPDALAAPAQGGGSSSATADPAASSSVARAKRAPAAVTQARGERKVQRNADLVLTVPNAKVDATADGVIRTVDRFGGIVATSSSNKQGGHGEASFDLRIPTDRLDDALAALSKLGHVSERHQDLVDITGSFTSVQDRLSDARAERRGLLKALGRASTQQQIDSLRARLRTVRSQIARLDGDLDALRRRADLSTVSVSVRGTSKGSNAVPVDGGSWSPGDAAGDALRVLEVSAGVALVALAVLVPLALLGFVAWLGVRATRNRRRESALDAA
jgi:hypothetical protein